MCENSGSMRDVMCKALDMDNVHVIIFFIHILDARLPRLIVRFGMPAGFVLTRSKTQRDCWMTLFFRDVVFPP